jgi:ribosomal protein S18 acetylase RimI-like enzyme
VTEAGADLLRRQGFETLQALHLLDLSLVGWQPPTSGRARSQRLRAGERESAAAVDLAAFGSMWAIDAAGIEETCTATPSHRARGRRLDGHLAGYAVTGRADHTGYLQRLAVHPAQQGHGVGLALTIDSLIWMQRRRLTRAIVNTHTDNAVALSLYRRVGFRVLPHGLMVLHRRLDDV